MNSTNIKLVYLYRDAGNYKKWGEVVFANDDQLACDQVLSQLEAHMDSGRIFIASQVRLPELFLATSGHPVDSDDHCFHELYSIEPTAESTSDLLDRDIREFLGEVLAAARAGWAVFDPSAESAPALD